MAKITQHAKERTLERTDMSLPDVRKASNLAYKHGYKVRAFKGAFYDFLNSKQIRGANYLVRVYEDNIYIFDARLKKMMTIYPVPSEFLPIGAWISESASPCIILVSVDGHWEYVCEGGANGTGFLTEDIGLATEFRTKQKAQNYIKNNNWISVMEAQGYVFEIMEL